MSRDPDSFNVKLAALGIIVAAGILFYPALQRDKLQEQYDQLQEQYDELQEQYYDLEDTYSEAIGKCEDPLITLYCYFEDEEITFDEARDAFNIIDKQISQFY